MSLEDHNRIRNVNPRMYTEKRKGGYKKKKNIYSSVKIVEGKFTLRRLKL